MSSITIGILPAFEPPELAGEIFFLFIVISSFFGACGILWFFCVDMPGHFSCVRGKAFIILHAAILCKSLRRRLLPFTSVNDFTDINPG